MPESQLCPECGASLPDDAPDGSCPTCALRDALALGVNTGEWSDPSSIVTFPSLPREIRRFGDYELLEEIARGGMGIVYKARQVRLNRVVAVKTILGGQMAGAADMQRFRAEAEAVAQLQHPNIVSIHEVGEHEGQPYFSMDYIEGKSLTALIREGPIPAQRAARYVRTMAEAIHYAHLRGILHRDLKPSNVLIDTADEPRITDFGLAKRIGRDLELTLTGQVLGSPNFLAPEQAAGERGKIGTQSDIYSLGAILYYLLTGRPPLMAETLEQTLYAVLHSDPVAPRVFNPVIAPDLETISLKCLEKEPNRRYGTAQEVADELGRSLRDEPILTRPVSQPEKALRWARRNRVVASLIAAKVLVFITGLTGVIWEWQRARRNAHAELLERRRADAALTQMEFQRAEDFFEADNSAAALAYLANLLRQDPSNRVVAERLVSALTYKSFALPLARPLQHSGFVWFVEFSSDGQRLLTTASEGDDRFARIWDARTGLPLTESLRLENPVGAFARFSPDGQRIVTASSEYTAEIRDSRTGRLVVPPLQHHDVVIGAQFSPDSKRVVTASSDRTGRVWDANTGKPLTEPLLHDSKLGGVEFAPDGKHVVTWCVDNSVTVWDVDTGRLVTKSIKHAQELFCLAISPDGQRIVTAAKDGARVWSVSTGALLAGPMKHEGGVLSAQFSPDGELVVTASWDDTARIWDSHTGQQVTLPLRHKNEVNFAQFSPDGRRVVTASKDSTARVWDAFTGQPLTQPLRHEGRVNHARFSPDGQRVVTASSDHTARIWDIRSGQGLALALPHASYVYSARFSPDGQRVLTGSGDQTARVWDAHTGVPLSDPLPHGAPVLVVQFSPDGLSLVTVSTNVARLWDARSARPLGTPMRHEDRIWSVSFSPDSRRLVTASEDKSAKIWDARTGLLLVGPVEHDGGIRHAEFSPDGQRVATASADLSARVWDAQTGQPLTSPLRHEYFVSWVSFSPDGRRLVTASADCTARLWDARTGQLLTVPFKHDASVISAAFSPDGERVITASHDKTARIWDVRTGRTLSEPLKHTQRPETVQFSPDGERVLTASGDGTLRIWNGHTGLPLSDPLNHERWVYGAQFSPDGQRVVTASDRREGSVWELPRAPVPVPEWLPELAEAVGGQRLNDGGSLEHVSDSNLPVLQQRLVGDPRTDYYARWGKWFFSDRATRTISPYSDVTFPEYVQRRIQENTLDSLREAARLSPTNAVALARLARQIQAENEPKNPRRDAEADFLSRHAAELASNEPEVLKLRVEVAERLSKLRNP